MPSPVSDVLSRSTERAAVYDVLAGLWRDEPSDELMSLLSQTAGDSIPTAWMELAENAGADCDDLAVEFTRLFIGPKEHLPPFQSVWQERQLEGEAAASMRKYGEVIGIERADDHLSTQLHAMSQILGEVGGAGPDTKLASLAVAFGRDHLTWPQEFLAAVERRTGSPFYRSLAKTTREFLAGEPW